MITVILVIHLMLAAALVGVIMVQKSEGGALGMGGGGMGGFMTGRSAANLLTRVTAILAAGFFATSIALAVISTQQRAHTSIIDSGTPPASSSPIAPGARTRCLSRRANSRPRKVPPRPARPPRRW
jgi:preprotein translocase subunit SecG